MAPLKKIYLEELARIQDRINGLFEQALLTSEYEDREGGLPGTWAPAVDVLETEDAYLIFAELPGVRRDEIQLQVRDRRLELSGRRQTAGREPQLPPHGAQLRSLPPHLRPRSAGRGRRHHRRLSRRACCAVHVPKRQAGGAQVEIAEEAG